MALNGAVVSKHKSVVFFQIYHNMLTHVFKI